MTTPEGRSGANVTQSPMSSTPEPRLRGGVTAPPALEMVQSSPGGLAPPIANGAIQRLYGRLRGNTQDDELVLGGVTAKANAPVSNPQAQLVASGELAYLGAGIVGGESFDCLHDARANALVETLEIPVGAPCDTDRPMASCSP